MYQKKFKLGEKVVGYFKGIGPVRGHVDFIELNGSIVIRSNDPKIYKISGHPVQIFSLEAPSTWPKLSHE